MKSSLMDPWSWLLAQFHLLSWVGILIEVNSYKGINLNWPAFIAEDKSAFLPA